VIDDFKPPQSARESWDMNAKAEHVFRSAASRIGRAVAKRDGSLRPARRA
jgi:hypothetical protein